jgi:hypothetical protein
MCASAIDRKPKKKKTDERFDVECVQPFERGKLLDSLRAAKIRTRKKKENR